MTGSGAERVVWRYMLLGAIAAAFTALVIQHSYAHGKLACPPTYDDVAYFEDALHRLEVFYGGGLVASIVDFAKSPPHSAFSSYLAAAAFATAGVRDWAPYAANALIVFGLLALLDVLLHGDTLARKLAVGALVLAVPISAEAVYEFRPDIASALCAAAGAILLLRRPLTETSWRYRATAGALFGMAVLFKPPTSPLTVAVFCAVAGMVTVIDLLQKNRDFRAARTAWLQCLAPMILIPLPQLAADWRETINYIYQPIFGPAHSVWARPGSRSWHMLFYLTGLGGQQMLGRMLWPLAALVAAGIAYALVRQNRAAATRILAMLCVAGVAYAVPAAIDVKEPFFGTTFTWLLTFAAVYVLADVLPRRGWIPASLLAVALAIGAWTARLGPSLFDRGSAVVVQRNRLVNELYAALLNERFPTYARVYMTSTGYVNPGVLDYYYRRDTLHALNIGANSYADDLAIHRRELFMSDYVIASEGANGEAFEDFVRSGVVQDQTLAIVRADPDFRQSGAFRTANGKHYYLFKRVNPFCGWVKPQGLVDAPASRFGVGNATSVVIPPEGPPKLRLVMSVRPRVAGLRVRVRADGRAVGQRLLRDETALETITMPFTIKGGGEHVVELTYDPPGANAEPAIEFGSLEIVPDELK